MGLGWVFVFTGIRNIDYVPTSKLVPGVGVGWRNLAEGVIRVIWVIWDDDLYLEDIPGHSGVKKGRGQVINGQRPWTTDVTDGLFYIPLDLL